MPSGNSVGALALLKLFHLTQEQEYQRPAVAILRTIRQAVAKYPSAFGYALRGLDFYLSEPQEIAIAGNPASHEVRAFVEEIYSRFLPNKVVAAREPKTSPQPSRSSSCSKTDGGRKGNRLCLPQLHLSRPRDYGWRAGGTA